MTTEALRARCVELAELIGAEASDAVPILMRTLAAERASEAEDILNRMSAQGMMDYPPCRSDDTIREFVTWCTARAAAWREMK